MSIEKPQPGMLVIQCDACEDHIDFTADEGQPADDMVACLKLAHELEWQSTKQTGFDWQHWCPDCAPAAALEAKRKRDADQEREQIKQRNARG